MTRDAKIATALLIPGGLYILVHALAWCWRAWSGQ